MPKPSPTPASSRPAATSSPRFPSRRAWLGLVLILIAPSAALVSLSHTINWRWLMAYFGILNLITFVLYRHDKRRAEKNGNRLPETTLHLLELAGGSPAAFLAQRALRHKSSKRRYQAVFWFIVALQQIVAADYVLGWPLTRRILLALG